MYYTVRTAGRIRYIYIVHIAHTQCVPSQMLCPDKCFALSNGRQNYLKIKRRNKRNYPTIHKIISLKFVKLMRKFWVNIHTGLSKC